MSDKTDRLTPSGTNFVFCAERLAPVGTNFAFCAYLKEIK